MKGFRQAVNEFWNGEPVIEAKEPQARIVKSSYMRERPERVTFDKLIIYHDLTPQIQIAVSSYKELITGTDIQVTAEKGQDEAKEFVEEWIRQTGFYDKFEGVVTTMLITGNALLEKLDEKKIEDVAEVDMSTIVSKERDEFGHLLYYTQRQQAGQEIKLGEHNIDKFIEFNLTNYSRQAWGRSLFYSLSIARTTGNRVTAPLVEILWGMEDAMAAIIQNNAFPITTITYPGANDEYLEKETERWRRFKPGDKRVQKIKPEINFFETSPASKYTDYVTHLEKVIELGTQFPHDIMTGDFTSRASSETTETIVMKKVRGFQRYLTSKLKAELFEPLLEQNGFNTEDVDISISFTTQNIVELTVDQVLKLYTDKAITLKEVRQWFAENTGMDLDDKEMKLLLAQQGIEQELQQQKMQMTQDKNFNKTIQKKEESFKKELSAREKQINELKEKLLLRESSVRSEKAALTREILEEMKKL